MSRTHPRFPPQVDRKLALSFGAVVLLLMVTVAGVASFLFSDLQRKEEDRLSSDLALILGESISRVSFSGKYHTRLLVEELQKKMPDLVFISVETPDGRVMAHSEPGNNDTALSPEALASVAASLHADRGVVSERRRAGKLIKEVVLPYRAGLDARVAGVVRLGINVEGVRREQRGNLVFLSILTAVLTLAAMGVVLLLSRHFGATVRALATRLQGILDHAPLAIGIGDAAGRTIARSRAFDQLGDRPDGEPVGPGAFGPGLAESDRARLGEIDREVFATGKSVEREVAVRIAERSAVWQLSKFPIARDGGDQVTLICTFIWDVTERKRAEQELRESEGKLRQAHKMESVGRLAGGVAHDFNNQLGVILGLVDLALEQVDPAQPLHADLIEIRSAAQRSAELTRQLLAFARKQTVAPKVLDLNETVAGLIKMLRRLIGEDIDLVWRPGPALREVKIDPSQIGQILANLCANARDAIAGVGKVAIETENAPLDEAFWAANPQAPRGDYVLLAVRDSGAGMPAEILQHLFEPFFTTKGLGHGTGLGLATVYGIVTQNRGFIDVRSEPGQGTAFKIYLPQHHGLLPPLQEEPPVESARGGRETVLLVEDEPAILSLGERLIRGLGYTVLTAGSPAEACRLADARLDPIHLLITDVVMPGMNGRDLSGRLLARFPNLKCLFMSGYTADVIAHHGILHEDVHFLQKPFSRTDLAAGIRAALEAPTRARATTPGS